MSERNCYIYGVNSWYEVWLDFVFQHFQQHQALYVGPICASMLYFCVVAALYGMYEVCDYDVVCFVRLPVNTQAIHWQKYITTGLPVSDTEVSVDCCCV